MKLEAYEHGFGWDRFRFYVGGAYKGQQRITIAIGWALMTPYLVRVHGDRDALLVEWIGEQAQAPGGGYLSPADVLERLGLGRAITLPPWLDGLMKDVAQV